MHVTNTFEHILAHHMLQFFKYAILLFDAKDIISLFLVSVTAPVKLYIATQNFDQFDCSVTVEGGTGWLTYPAWSKCSAWCISYIQQMETERLRSLCTGWQGCIDQWVMSDYGRHISVIQSLNRPNLESIGEWSVDFKLFTRKLASYQHQYLHWKW